MYSVIVVPPMCGSSTGSSGSPRANRLTFGRAGTDGSSPSTTRGSPVAGSITAHRNFWLLSNCSEDQTMSRGGTRRAAGEHIKIAPGRGNAPCRSSSRRGVLLAAGDLLAFESGRHATPPQRRAPRGLRGPHDAGVALDRTKALLRGPGRPVRNPGCAASRDAPLPAVEQLVDRLRSVWPTVSRSAVYWNIDYLAVKLRLRPGRTTADRACASMQEGVAGVSGAPLRLIREDDLAVLAPGPVPRTAGWPVEASRPRSRAVPVPRAVPSRCLGGPRAPRVPGALSTVYAARHTGDEEPELPREAALKFLSTAPDPATAAPSARTGRARGGAAGETARTGA